MQIKYEIINFFHQALESFERSNHYSRIITIQKYTHIIFYLDFIRVDAPWILFNNFTTIRCIYIFSRFFYKYIVAV